MTIFKSHSIKLISRSVFRCRVNTVLTKVEMRFCSSIEFAIVRQWTMPHNLWYALHYYFFSLNTIKCLINNSGIKNNRQKVLTFCKSMWCCRCCLECHQAMTCNLVLFCEKVYIAWCQHTCYNIMLRLPFKITERYWVANTT